MKKIIVKIIALALSLLAISSLVACGDTGAGGGGGDYAYRRVSANYLAQPATCTTPAKYYFSNKAGEKGTETFEMGPAYCNYIDHVCTVCGKAEVYTEGLNFFVNNNGQAVLRGKGTATETEIIVPQKFENKPVEIVSANAFKDSDIKSIKLPEGLKRIEMGAFENADNLATISIPSTVEFVGATAFYGCEKFDKIYFVNPYHWYRNKFITAGKDIDECYKPEKFIGNKAVDDWASEVRKEKTYSFFRVYE